MAICLDYQAVYCRREKQVVSVKLQIMAALLLLAVLSFRVWLKIESTNLGYQIARERQKTVDYDMERRELELQRSVLLRPDNLSRIAKQKLGLESLRPGQGIKLSY